jgi:hypothetical protein
LLPEAEERMVIFKDLEASQTPLVGTFCDQGNLENSPMGSKPGYRKICPAPFCEDITLLPEA